MMRRLRLWWLRRTARWWDAEFRAHQQSIKLHKRAAYHCLCQANERRLAASRLTTETEAA